MKQIKHPLFGIVSLLMIFGSTSQLASTNAIVDKNKAKVALIEKLIRQHVALGRLKNTFFHPIIANKISQATRNPFLDAPKSLYAVLAKQGINLSVLSRYKAIYLRGEYYGSQARKIINTSPNTVLVIGKGFGSHEPIFSRGPVVVTGDADRLAGVYGNNIVWFNKLYKSPLPTFSSFVGMPVVHGRELPNIIIAPQAELNKIKRNRQGECQRYTNAAVKQYNEGRQLGCGFAGTRWNNNWKGQYNWCMTTLAPVTMTEDSFRTDSLEKCKVLKLSSTNPKNRPAIPAQCNDPSKQFGAVKQINHSFRYEQMPTSPVQNGLIRYDYNRDKRPDYVFLEAKVENSRAVICMSNGANYQRHMTDIKIYSGRSGIGSLDHQITQNGDTLKVDIQYFEHNAGSSHTNASYRYQPNTKKFRVISKKSNTDGIVQDGYPYPISAPPVPKLY